MVKILRTTNFNILKINYVDPIARSSFEVDIDLTINLHYSQWEVTLLLQV